MASADIDEQLDLVRREIRALQGARRISAPSDEDRERYDALCQEELSLLAQRDIARRSET